MNEEQLIATLQACYFGDKGAYNKILKEYKQLKEKYLNAVSDYETTKSENQQLLETSKAYKKLLKTTMQKEHKATNLINDLKEWLYEQECKSWDEVSNTFAYVRDKIEELENERV